MRVLASLLLGALLISGEARRVRRRRPGPPNKRMCAAQNPNLYFTMIGEKTDEKGMFLIPDPKMPYHRDIMGFTDADIAKYWAGTINQRSAIVVSSSVICRCLGVLLRVRWRRFPQCICRCEWQEGD